MGIDLFMVIHGLLPDCHKYIRKIEIVEQEKVMLTYKDTNNNFGIMFHFEDKKNIKIGYTIFPFPSDSVITEEAVNNVIKMAQGIEAWLRFNA